MPLFDEVRKRRVVILDGGMSNALEDRGHDLSDDLWTARLLRDYPADIVAVHRAYFEAGADVATAASYQASMPGLIRAGLPDDAAAGLIRSSVYRAREAAQAVAASTGRELLAAASVGPYGATLADGSEYRGRYGVSAATLRNFHAPRLELLASAAPDLLAVETIPDLDEAEVLVRLLDALGLPAWFSYSVSGGRRAQDSRCSRRTRSSPVARRSSPPGSTAPRQPTSSPPSRRRSRSLGSQVSPIPTAVRRGTPGRTPGRARDRSTPRSLTAGWRRGHA